MQTKIISEEAFYDTYRPKKNPFDAHAAWDGCMLETYGEELSHVQAVLKTAPDTIWTVLDCDGELMVGNGYQHVNRMGYIITEIPAPADTWVVVEDPENLEKDSDEDEDR